MSIGSAGTLNMDFQPPGGNKCLLFKPPSLWYFVMAARVDGDIENT